MAWQHTSSSCHLGRLFRLAEGLPIFRDFPLLCLSDCSAIAIDLKSDTLFLDSLNHALQASSLCQLPGAGLAGSRDVHCSLTKHLVILITTN